MQHPTFATRTAARTPRFNSSVSNPSRALEQRAHGPSGTEHVQRRMLRALRQDREFSFALRVAASADAPCQRRFVVKPSPGGLIAAGWQREASRTLAYPARERALCADPPGCIEEHNRVRPLDPQVERGVIVAVDDPFPSREQFSLLVSPLVLGRRNPPRFPEVDVEMDYGQPGLGRQRSRERALTRSGHTCDHDAATDRDRGPGPSGGAISAHLWMFAAVLPRPATAPPWRGAARRDRVRRARARVQPRVSARNA
jgi:hypothetical protein